jgi:hypothetical protein
MANDTWSEFRQYMGQTFNFAGRRITLVSFSKRWAYLECPQGHKYMMDQTELANLVKEGK